MSKGDHSFVEGVVGELKNLSLDRKFRDINGESFFGSGKKPDYSKNRFFRFIVDKEGNRYGRVSEHGTIELSLTLGNIPIHSHLETIIGNLMRGYYELRSHLNCKSIDYTPDVRLEKAFPAHAKMISGYSKD